MRTSGWTRRRWPGDVAAHRIDLVNLTPFGILQQLLPAGLLTGPEHRPGILLAGGEPLGEPLWRQLAAVPGTVSYNVYGPTECTVDALSCPVAPSDRPSLRPAAAEHPRLRARPFIGPGAGGCGW